jgi:hypothetical protein
MINYVTFFDMGHTSKLVDMLSSKQMSRKSIQQQLSFYCAVSRLSFGRGMDVGAPVLCSVRRQLSAARLL